MGYRFNPPPNWPPPPPGWSPPPGWRPDPSWPPPPQGWQFWVLEEEPAGPPPAPQRAWRRARAWFARLPAWAKLLVALLVLGLLPWVLIAAGLALAALGIVGLLRGPLPRFKLTSRAAAVGALLLGLVGIGAGGALAVAVLNPPPTSPTTRPPVVAPTTKSAPATAAPTTAPPATTAAPATTRPPTTTAKQAATTRPPRSSAPASTARPALLCGAPPNPYGYNFCGRGGYVVDPAADVCDYFDCIDNFWNGQGHMEECQDHTYSMSGGRPGSCSYHGGNLRPVYRGP